MKINKILFAIAMMSSLAYANDCTNINAEVQKIITQNQITGMAIAVVNQDNIEFCNFGYTSKNKKKPITEKSIFEIASITKTFTALLAGIAIFDHKLDLDAPITKYVPELLSNKNYSKINNKELLTHVSGLPLRFEKSFTEKELIDSLINMKFTNESAVTYQYSNPGIALSGLALTRIYNKNFQNLLGELILDKLDMKHTSIDLNPENKNLMVTGYNKNEQIADYMNIGIENPAGGLKSNTYDLAKYLQLQINPQNSIFQQALAIVHKNYYCLYANGTYQQLTWEYHPYSALSERFQADDKNRNILPPHALPMNCNDSPNGFIDKTGNSSGMTSYIGYIPNKKIGVIILSNSALKPDIVNLGRYILRETSPTAAAKNSPISKGDIISFINQWRLQNHVTSVVLNIKNTSTNKEIHFTSGTTTRLSKQPVTTDTLYGVGSISKTFVAATLLQLQEEGKLTLDTPIADYFPIYPRWKAITIRQLLNMTSGIYNFTESQTFQKLHNENPKNKIEPSQLIQIAYNHRDDYKPGKKWKYSNTNYVLAGLIIEKITKKSLETVYQERFFSPLKLKKTYYSNALYPYSIVKNMAHAYENGHNRLVVNTQFNAGLWGAAGGMIMNSQDLLNWVQALFTPGKILSEQSLAEMKKTNSIGYAPPKPPNSRFGLGVYSLTVNKLGEIWWYTGIIAGYTSAFVWIPEMHTIIVAQAASWPADTKQILSPNETLMTFIFSKLPNQLGQLNIS